MVLRAWLIAVAALLLPSVLGVLIPIEHSLDGKSFAPAGHISFGDDVLISQGGRGTYERPELSSQERAALQSLVDRNGIYALRVAEKGVPASTAPLASLPAVTWARSGHAPALSLSLLAEGGVSALAFDAHVEGAAGEVPHGRVPAGPASVPVRIAFPVETKPVTGSDAANQPQAAAGASAKEAAAGKAAKSIEVPVGQGIFGEGENGELSAEQKKQAELKKKREEWEKKSWIEKNWMLVIPGALLLLNRFAGSPGNQGAGAARPQAAAVRR